VIAIYIDPLVCHTWVGWILPECYGIAIFAPTTPIALFAAVGLAYMRKSSARLTRVWSRA
jgi:hypothetical protein